MKTYETEFVDLEHLVHWFFASPPGAVLIYAIGDVGTDRRRAGRFDPLNAVADEVFRWQKQGRALLFQRKLAPSRYEYRIIRQESFARAVRRAEQRTLQSA
jgi:hypothetical protein